jgi:hypothetical protein
MTFTNMADLDEVYRAVGHFTVNWSSLEMALDSCNLIFYRSCSGRERIDEHLPRSLKPKLRFFRDCLNKLPVLADYKIDGIKLADRISAMKRDRHDSVHSFILDWNPETKAIARSIVEIDKNVAKFRDHTVTIPQMHAWATETGEMALDLLNFTQSLLRGIVEPKMTLRGNS